MIERRYQNLKVGEALSGNHLYPSACNELSSIINLGYSLLPKDLKASIFQDTLSAFRLLPDVNTSAAVSAANHLLKSVESVLPKQKKHLAIVEFKQAKVALKRRSKSHEEDVDMPSLPIDIIIHIFSFLDVSSLLSSSQVSRAWYQAMYDDSLWQSQFKLHFNYKVQKRVQSSIDWRDMFKKAYIMDKSSTALRSCRGFCVYCESIVWHDNFRCPNKQCRLKSGDKPVELITTHEVVNYLLGRVTSSDESESDDEAIPGLWAYPSLH